MAVEIVCVIDRSGSMANNKGQMACDGFNEFVMKQKLIEGYAELTLALFSMTHHYVCKGRALELVTPLTYEILRPDGGTRITRTVYSVLTNVMNRRGKNDHVVFMVLTDGEESTPLEGDTQPSDVARLIAECEDKYDWSFLFVSVDNEGPAKAKELGFAHCHKFQDTGEGVKKSFKAMNEFSSMSRTGGVD